MRFKFSVILILGFLSTFIGEIKAEELEVCNYSKPAEFASCKKKNNVKVIPNYPVDTFDHYGALWIGSVSSYQKIMGRGTIFKVVELRAPNKDEIEITIGDKESNIWGSYSIGDKFISSKTFRINREDIISWEYFNTDRKIGGGGLFDTSGFNHLIYKLDLKYLDENGKTKNIIANRAWAAARPKRIDIISNLLTNVTRMNNGEQKDIYKTLLSKLNRIEKNVSIIKSIINSGEEISGKCFRAKQTKFPELTEKYKKLYKTINPLRSKLDLPPKTDIKPICS